MSRDIPWFALYDEVLNDNKLARIKRATRQPRLVVIGAWTALLALSNQSPVRGVLLIREDRPLSTQEIFDEWDMDGGEGQALLDAFADQGLVCHEGEALVICNWEKRQPKIDKSTDRVRRWRERNAAASGLNSETGETFRNGYKGTLRNDSDRELEKEYKEREKGGEGGSDASEGATRRGGDDDDLYSFERTLGGIVAEGVDPRAGTRPRDPDDKAAGVIWGRLLTLCDDDGEQAGAVAVVANELADKLDWLKPFPRNEKEFQSALTDWWQPIKQALKGRGWDREVTIQAIVAAAQAMQQRQMSPSCPRAVAAELSKQKTASSRASPQPVAANGSGVGKGGLDEIRAKIQLKGVGHGRRDNGAG